MEIAHRFAKIRKHLNLKQQEMAKCCGIDQTMISRIEVGKRDLPLSAVKALFNAHRISPLYILTGIDPITLSDQAINHLTKNAKALNDDPMNKESK